MVFGLFIGFILGMSAGQALAIWQCKLAFKRGQQNPKAERDVFMDFRRWKG